ncbi:unnamed protein product [Staurois parvus]|uniref:Secreted protein n=1 Tax=Staurois parvus TaxID=386267 RepID=A0ABN9CIV8_9NEOB|nr:unnamed protein product [Staurois parvus]
MRHRTASSMLLARARVCHGSLVGLPLLLSPSPHFCHVPLSGLSTTQLLWVPFCHRVLADYGPPIAAARPVICHGPLLPPPQCCCQMTVICHGSL